MKKFFSVIVFIFLNILFIEISLCQNNTVIYPTKGDINLNEYCSKIIQSKIKNDFSGTGQYINVLMLNRDIQSNDQKNEPANFKSSNNLPYIMNNINLLPTGLTENALGSDAIAINKNLNIIYIANSLSNTVSIIDGDTKEVLMNLPVGFFPTDIAVNNITNKAYVVNYGDNSVSIINCLTNEVNTVQVNGPGPSSIIINENSNYIYVANKGYSFLNFGTTVSVIDGRTDTECNVISVGDLPSFVRYYVCGFLETVDFTSANPHGLAINNITNQIAVPIRDSLIIIDGDTSSKTLHQVVSRYPAKHSPTGIVIDSENNNAYVIGMDRQQSMCKINMSSGEKVDLGIGGSLTDIVFDQQQKLIVIIHPDFSTTSGRIRILDIESEEFSSIDIQDWHHPTTLCLDEINHKVYIPFHHNSCNQPFQACLVDFNLSSCTYELFELEKGRFSKAIEFNSQSDEVILTCSYPTQASCTNIYNTDLKEINRLPTASYPSKIIANPNLGELYIIDELNDEIIIFDESLMTISNRIKTNRWPKDIAFNRFNNKLFIAHEYGNLMVVNTYNITSSEVDFYHKGNSKVAVNPILNKVYLGCVQPYNEFYSYDECRIYMFDGNTLENLLFTIIPNVIAPDLMLIYEELDKIFAANKVKDGFVILKSSDLNMEASKSLWAHL